MLVRAERKVMATIYGACKDKNSLLIEPIDLLKMVAIPDLTLGEIEKIVIALSQDGYIDLIYTDRRGQTAYCIALTEKGKGFLRDGTNFKRNVIFRILLSLGLAVFSFLVGLILRNVF